MRIDRTIARRTGRGCWCCGRYTAILFYRDAPTHLFGHLTWCWPCKYGACDRCGDNVRHISLAEDARRYRHRPAGCGCQVCTQTEQPRRHTRIKHAVLFIMAGLGLTAWGCALGARTPDPRWAAACAIAGAAALLVGGACRGYARTSRKAKARTEKIEGRVQQSTSTDHFLDGAS